MDGRGAGRASDEAIADDAGERVARYLIVALSLAAVALMLAGCSAPSAPGGRAVPRAVDSAYLSTSLALATTSTFMSA